MEKIDLAKVEEAALSAIDELFSEEDSGYADPSILKLEEAILSLDWEFDEIELTKLLENINELRSKYSDKVNSIVLTIIENITKFLAYSKELAPPNTITVLGQLAKIFKEINIDNLSDSEKKDKVKDVYEIFTKFKEDIEKIKAKVKKEQERKKAETEKIKREEISDERLKDILQKEIKGYIKAVLDEKFNNIQQVIKEHLDSSENILRINEDIQQLSKDIKKISMSLELVLGLRSELEVLKEKLEDISSQIVSVSKPVLDTTSKKEEVIIESEEEIKEESVEESFEDNTTLLEGLKEKEEEPLPLEEQEEGDLVELVEKEEWPYVRIFSYGGKLIAIPIEYIANIYSISNSKAINLLKKDMILLKEVKSFWRKLKTNLRGDLKRLNEKELKKLEVSVLRLSLEDEEIREGYKSAVLLGVDDRYGVLFLGKPFKKVYFPEKGKPSEKEFIKAEIEISEGKAFLLDVEAILS